jgi:hypothetical protein
LSATKQKNVATFKNKWGAIHLKGLRKWEAHNPLHKIEGFIRKTHKSTKLSADFLILIPSLDDHSGGSKMVIALFEQLWRTGRTARLLSTIRDIHRNSAWAPVSERIVKKSQFPNVITTGDNLLFNGNDTISATYNSNFGVRNIEEIVRNIMNETRYEGDELP